MELIATAVRRKQPIISCMGAGGKVSPHLVQVCPKPLHAAQEPLHGWLGTAPELKRAVSCPPECESELRTYMSHTMLFRGVSGTSFHCTSVGNAGCRHIKDETGSSSQSCAYKATQARR